MLTATAAEDNGADELSQPSNAMAGRVAAGAPAPPEPSPAMATSSKPDPPTSAPQAVTDFDSSPSYLIAALANKITVIAARNLRTRLGLSLMEWRVLAVLAAEPAATPGRIVDFAGVNKSVVSRAVASLQKRGLVTRAASPDHGLRTHLFLTDAGHEAHGRGLGDRLEAEDRLLAGLAATDRDRLVALLKQLGRNIEPA